MTSRPLKALHGVKTGVKNRGVARIFDWGGGKPQITWNDVFRNFEKWIFRWGKDIVEWKIGNLGLVLARNLELV